MSDSDGGEKTEAPTGKRLSEARDEGQIAKSPEFMTAAFLLGATLTLTTFGPTLWRFLLDSMGRGLSTAGDSVLAGTGAVSMVQGMFWKVLAALAGIVCSMAVIAIAVQTAQTGGLLSTKPLEPKWSRMNPLSNAKRIVGVQSIIELTKAILKLLIVSWVVYLTLRKAWPDIQNLALQSPEALMVVVNKYGLAILRNAGMMFLTLGLVDYGVQRWRTMEQLKMTKDQVKEENKASEGDPQIKGRRRAVARERLRRQMFANVKKADVVIVNPVHIAIALKYDTSVAPAPYVVAIGQRLIAKRIKELAFQHGVPVIENKPLARALFAQAKVGTTIPVEMYLAVAEVLAFVLKQRERYGSAWRGTAVA